MTTPEQQAMLDELIATIPQQPRIRWYFAVDGRIVEGRGFVSKQEAATWIHELHEARDWQAGFVFRIKGFAKNLEIVDKDGVRAKY